MNQYTKHVWKRNITAFAMACAILSLLGLVVLVLAYLASLLKEYLPYITTGILLFLFALGLSIPIRYHLEDKEIEKERQRLKRNESMKEIIKTLNQL